MFTKTKNKKTGEITEYQTQKYEIGTYLIINHDPAQQMGLNCTEQEFHDHIRANKKIEVITQ